MKVLFATHNKAKLKSYKKKFENSNLEIVSLSDLNIDYDVEETGNTAEENAIQKAKEYYNLVKIPTIAVDDALELVGIPEELQPGTHVRRVNGNERASDQEMLDYYTSLVKKYGEDGKLVGYWHKCIAVMKEDKVEYYNFSSKRIFTETISDKIDEGYPLSSISKIPEYDKYIIDLTSEENAKLDQEKNEKLSEFISRTFN